MVRLLVLCVWEGTGQRAEVRAPQPAPAPLMTALGSSDSVTLDIWALPSPTRRTGQGRRGKSGLPEARAGCCPERWAGQGHVQTAAFEADAPFPHAWVSACRPLASGRRGQLLRMATSGPGNGPHEGRGRVTGALPRTAPFPDPRSPVRGDIVPGCVRGGPKVRAGVRRGRGVSAGRSLPFQDPQTCSPGALGGVLPAGEQKPGVGGGDS